MPRLNSITADWIKVRLDLFANPKVLVMVDALAKHWAAHIFRSPEDLFSGVSPRAAVHVPDVVSVHVLRDVTVAGLVRVWGVANTFLRDGVVPSVGLDWVDFQAGIPGFGRAMERAGWLTVDTERKGLSFPNFEEWNSPKSLKIRSSEAARKERYRLKKRLAELPADDPERTVVETRLSRLLSTDKGRDATGTEERRGDSTELSLSDRAEAWPKSEEEARSLAARLGIEADYAASVWLELEGTSRRDSKGGVVHNFEPHLKARWMRYGRRQVPTSPKPTAGEKLPERVAYARREDARAELATLKRKSFTAEADRQAALRRIGDLEQQIANYTAQIP